MKFNKKIKNLESEWFGKNINQFAKIFYIPRAVFTDLSLNNGDPIAVEINSGANHLSFPVRVSKKVTDSGTSFGFNMPSRYKANLKNNLLVRITKLNKIDYSINCVNKIIKIKIKDFDVTNWLDDNSAVIWQKYTGKSQSHPLLTKKVLELDSDILSYLGLYMADGNSKGYYKLFTSTKEIFKLALKCYSQLILNPAFDININYDKFNTDKSPESSTINKIKSYWKDVIPDLDRVKIYLGTRRQNAKSRSKSHVEFGTLFIKDNRLLSRIFHTFLINLILNEFKNNKEILTHFFIGAALGDFYPSIRPRNDAFNWLEIATNKQEVSIWKAICETLGYKYKEKIREGNGVLLCVTGYTKNIELLKNGLFLQYQKRRNRMIKGMKNRVETYILSNFRKLNTEVIKLDGEFLKKTNSFFIVHEGLDLVENNLIKFNREVVSITDKGHDFIDNLIELNILEAD